MSNAIRRRPPIFQLRPRRRGPQWVLVGVAMAFALGACGNKITIVECPLGTQPVGSECVAWGTVDVGTPDIVTPVEDTFKPDSERPDIPIFPTLDTDGESSELPETTSDISGDGSDDGPDITPPEKGAIGAACVKNADCEDGICLDWPGGHCTRFDCDATPCPLASSCLELAGGTSACIGDCATTEDCRPGGEQACKPVGSEGGGLCHGVAPDAGAVGRRCISDLACLNILTCGDTLPGGYCTVEDCTADTCPEGSACVNYAGASLCLQQCADDDACDGAPDAERRCAAMVTVDKKPVNACISNVEGAPVGDSCATDLACTSGLCEILGEGRCSLSDKPCSSASEAADCGPAEHCIITGVPVGTCTQVCSVGVACPGVSLCAGQPGADEVGRCRIPCEGVGPFDDCPDADGFVCTFGYALGDATGQGKYLCRREVPGSVGTACSPELPCTAAAECDGTCVSDCSASLFCPFPATCVFAAGGTPECRKACVTGSDCPDGSSCGAPPGAIRPVCQLK